MASEDRPPAHDLSQAFLRDLDLKRAGLFAVLRQLEARAPSRPRIGRARRPDQSIADLAQEPGLAFEAATLSRIETRKGRPQVRGRWLGLTGPMGPLPSHLSEFALYERRHAKKRPFGDWLDLLAGRMLQLFYRAWAQSQPAAQADRPRDDAFAGWLAALTGAMDGAGGKGSFHPRARVHYAGLFSGLRSAVAIEDGLSHLLGQPVRVSEFMPRWRDLAVEDRTRLGSAYNRLGGDAILGRQVFSAADAFRVTVRAASWRDYRSMMPGGERFMVAAEAIEAFKPSHLEWDLCVELDDALAPPARLDGRGRLGWSTWVKRAGRGSGAAPALVRADAHLRKSSMNKTRIRKETPAR